MAESKQHAVFNQPVAVDPAAEIDETQATAVWAGHARRRRLFIGLCLVLALAAAIPGVLWLQHQAAYVTTGNAIARSHLARIGTRLEGVVAEVLVDAGERVEAGQVLVRLEDSHIQARIRQASASVVALEREIEAERAAIGQQRRRVDNLAEEAESVVGARRSELAAARSRMEDTAAFYDARRALLSEGAIATEVVRDAEAKARTAAALEKAAAAELGTARVLRRRAELAADEVALRVQQLGVLEARLEQARGILDAARADLASTVVRAPQDGAVIRRLAEAGTSTDIGVPLVSMWLSGDTWMEAWIPEAEVGDIDIGSAVEVTFNAFPDEVVQGVVKTIGLTTDYEMPIDYVPQPRATRMDQAPVIGVAVELENPPVGMRPGMTAIVAIRRAADGERS